MIANQSEGCPCTAEEAGRCPVGLMSHGALFFPLAHAVKLQVFPRLVIAGVKPEGLAIMSRGLPELALAR